MQLIDFFFQEKKEKKWELEMQDCYSPFQTIKKQCLITSHAGSISNSRDNIGVDDIKVEIYADDAETQRSRREGWCLM